ncbi:uncharacterized protein LOC113516538 isoform X2 [Galleria mellonella]|uniref:Uncharacterized protein LOC113516538 isoform X2 n=1 Tax=Galleria mellonella TaxID=7137 RepID=A0ABM3MD58_GALME|nr:uncharacterized protein LOC113516538 isoform X2 [Galleria mellonella]
MYLKTVLFVIVSFFSDVLCYDLCSETRSCSFDINYSPQNIEQKLVTKKVGENFEYTCFGGNNKQIETKWSQYMNYGNKFVLWQLHSVAGYMFTYKGKVYGFDNNTIMSCIKNYNIIEDRRIIVTPAKDMSITKAIIYNDSMVYDTSCTGNYWLHINDKNEIINKTKDNSYKASKNFSYSIKLTGNDFNTTLYCIKFECSMDKTLNKTCIRKIIKTIIFQYHNNTIQHTENFNKSSLIVPVVSVVIVLIVLFIFMLYWKKTSISRRNNSNQENLYATPNVQYAELQAMNSITNRQVKKDDFPYSEIIGILEPKNKASEVHYEEIQRNMVLNKEEDNRI